MKKILSLFIAIMIISTCVFAQSIVSVSKGSSQRIDFSEAFSENSVFQILFM